MMERDRNQLRRHCMPMAIAVVMATLLFTGACDEKLEAPADRSQQETRIAELERENQALRLQAAKPGASEPPAPMATSAEDDDWLPLRKGDKESPGWRQLEQRTWHVLEALNTQRGKGREGADACIEYLGLAINLLRNRDNAALSDVHWWTFAALLARREYVAELAGRFRAWKFPEPGDKYDLKMCAKRAERAVVPGHLKRSW